MSSVVDLSAKQVQFKKDIFRCGCGEISFVDCIDKTDSERLTAIILTPFNDTLSYTILSYGYLYSRFAIPGSLNAKPVEELEEKLEESTDYIFDMYCVGFTVGSFMGKWWATMVDYNMAHPDNLLEHNLFKKYKKQDGYDYTRDGKQLCYVLLADTILFEVGSYLRDIVKSIVIEHIEKRKQKVAK